MMNATSTNTRTIKMPSSRLYGSDPSDKYITNHYATNKAVAGKKRFSMTFQTGTTEYYATLVEARTAVNKISNPEKVFKPIADSSVRVTPKDKSSATAVQKPESKKANGHHQAASTSTHSNQNPQVILATDKEGKEYAVNLVTKRIAAF